MQIEKWMQSVPKPNLRKSPTHTSKGIEAGETARLHCTKELVRPYRPNELECALLLLALIDKKEQETGREITRLRLAELTLERLWSRHRPSNQFLEEIINWLFGAGWVLFYAGSSFAMVRIDTIEGWPRISSKGMKEDLKKVVREEYDFAVLYPKLMDNEVDES